MFGKMRDDFCHSNINLSLLLLYKEIFSMKNFFREIPEINFLSFFVHNFCARLRVTIDPESVCLFPKGLRLFEAAMRAAQEVTG